MANGTSMQQLQVRVAVAMILMAVVGTIGGWMLNTHADRFGDLLTVQHVGGLLMQLSSVVLAWFTKNPTNLQAWTPEKSERRKNGEGENDVAKD
jgi:hypothetical protein